ncbi:MAG: hypothetical protein ACR2OZ_21040 [Verrucomicrobiales bacterium]
MSELWVGFFNKDSGKGGLTYAEAVDEALCFGWNFSQITFPQLAPGFNADLTFINGNVRLTALTDAVAAEPPPEISEISLNLGEVTLAWTTVSGRRYQIEAKEDLKEPAWIPVSAILIADGNSLSMNFSISGSPQRFYRVAQLETQ